MASLPARPLPPTKQIGAPLPLGWTEHKAPTGHSYYYNAITKTSTYTRPSTSLPPLYPPFPNAPQHVTPTQVFHAHQQQSLAPTHQLPNRPFFQDFQGAHRRRPSSNRGGSRPPPLARGLDKPKKKRSVLGAESWVLVTTRMGRQFVHNLSTKVSLWNAPQEVQNKIDVMPPVDRELEKQERVERKRRKATGKVKKRTIQEAFETLKEKEKDVEVVLAPEGKPVDDSEPTTKKPRLGDGRLRPPPTEEVPGEEDEEEDEDEEEEEEEESHSNQPPGVQEFTEEDVAWQLEAMAEQYGLEDEDFEEGDELTAEDSIKLFREMLDEYAINPYSTWDDALPRFVDDNRYTVVTTTKARKAVFTDWCKDKAAQLREEKEKSQKIDPRIPFWEFLKERSTTKLFWAEFKRKWRKEPVMKDTKLSDKEREKMYRDYAARTKGSAPILENDLKKLLKATSSLSKQTTLQTLPSSILADVRYITAPEASRDTIIAEYLSTLPDAPISEVGRKEIEERERRDKALLERELAVRLDKRRNAADEAMAKQFLRGEEAAIERAKKVGKRGLLGHLKKEMVLEGKESASSV